MWSSGGGAGGVDPGADGRPGGLMSEPLERRARLIREAGGGDWAGRTGDVLGRFELRLPDTRDPGLHHFPAELKSEATRGRGSGRRGSAGRTWRRSVWTCEEPRWGVCGARAA